MSPGQEMPYSLGMDRAINSERKMAKPIVVGAFCELRIYSGSRSARLEIYDCHVIELCGAAIARVQIVGGGILRVVTSQLRVI